jgi:hypothetical protein
MVKLDCYEKINPEFRHQLLYLLNSGGGDVVETLSTNRLLSESLRSVWV